mmetsp:Transcript_64675/g.140880  ORF Transcript_64675/g.140880 Transcript_64675/m.140880 type:complete len:217 (+) Transcript_64675:1672-2322(+)
MVHSLPGHASCDSSVADDCDAVPRLAQSLSCLCEAHGCADGRGRVPRPEGVEGRLGALREARKTSGLTQRVDAIPTACENFVRLALVRDIPADLIAGCVEDVVQRDCQVRDAQTCPKVSASDRYSIKNLPSDLLGQVLQLLHGHASHGCDSILVDHVEQRRLPRREVTALRDFPSACCVQFAQLLPSGLGICSALAQRNAAAPAQPEHRGHRCCDR